MGKYVINPTGVNVKKTTWDIRKLAAWAGMIGSALFVLVFILEGFLRPGYNPSEMYISAISLGPRGWIQITNFILLGILLFVSSGGIAAEFRTGKASQWGLILLTTISALFVVSGLFVMDPTSTPPHQATVDGTIHGLAGGLVFLLMPNLHIHAPFPRGPELAIASRLDPHVGHHRSNAVFFFTGASKSRSAQAVFAGWMGLVQRSALVPFMIWIFFFALGLLKRINRIDK